MIMKKGNSSRLRTTIAETRDPSGYNLVKTNSFDNVVIGATAKHKGGTSDELDAVATQIFK